MKAVVQRVKGARLSVAGKLISDINEGLVVYFGVAKGDSEEKADWFAKKIAAMRIFEDDNGKMNFSALDKGFEVLAVSQFTLTGDCSHGSRPDFFSAEESTRANELYEYFIKKLEEKGVVVKKGVFGTYMTIEQINNGPVTTILEERSKQ